MQWSFGDGSTLTEVGSPTAAHTYANPGLYQVKIRISNALGEADKASTVYVTRIPATVVTTQRNNNASEADESVTIHVTRSGDLSLASSVDWTLAPDSSTTAVIGPASGTIAFAPGEGDHSLTFPIFNDHRYRFDGYEAPFFMTLSPDGESAGLCCWDALHMLAMIDIQEADPIPVGTIHDVSVSKTASSVRVPFDLSGAFAYPCCRAYFQWKTIDGTAVYGKDFGSEFGEVNVAPDRTSLYVEIPLKANPKPGTRSFDVQLQYPTFPLARSRATVTIVDDTPAIVADPAHMSLPAGAYASLSLSVDPPRTEDVTVNVMSSDPTVATVSSPVVIPAGGRATMLVHAIKPGHPTISITPAGGTPAAVDVQVVFARRRAANP